MGCSEPLPPPSLGAGGGGGGGGVEVPHLCSRADYRLLREGISDTGRILLQHLPELPIETALRVRGADGDRVVGYVRHQQLQYLSVHVHRAQEEGHVRAARWKGRVM